MRKAIFCAVFLPSVCWGSYNPTTGGGGTSGSITSSNQQNVAYYSALGSSTTINGSTSFQFFGSSISVNGTHFSFPFTNTFIGGSNYPGNALTSGVNNVGIGTNSTDQITTGNNNTAVGYLTHDRLTIGTGNTTFGSGAGDDLIDGSANTCIGGPNGNWQPCQSILHGSSNTMVGDGTGSITMSANDSGNTFLGFNAGPGANGDSGMVYSTCIGYACIVNSSNTMVLGGTGSFSEYVNTSSMTISSATVGALTVKNISSGQTLQAGSGGVITGVTAVGLASTNTWTGGNTFMSSTTLQGSVVLSGMSDTQIAFVNSAKVITGDPNLVWSYSGSAEALNLGGGATYSSDAINIDNEGNGGSNPITFNASGGTSTGLLKWLNSGSQTGIYGVAGTGAPDGGPLWKWRGSTTSDEMNLDDTGLLSLPGPKGGGLSVTYGVVAATGTFTTSVKAGTSGSGTQLFRCSGGTDGGWILYGNTGAAQTLCTGAGGTLVAISYFAP